MSSSWKVPKLKRKLNKNIEKSNHETDDLTNDEYEYKLTPQFSTNIDTSLKHHIKNKSLISVSSRTPLVTTADYIQENGISTSNDHRSNPSIQTKETICTKYSFNNDQFSGAGFHMSR